ncbi:MAG TPA: hypothetical protein VNA25_06810 [Phycisphaerae bacterium]|nr:hypothetical protein [Phycisphaerae bacterium]
MLGRIMRPERLRRDEEDVKRKTVMRGPQATATLVQQRQDVEAMLESPGWRAIQAKLVEKNRQLWAQFKDPTITGDRAVLLRQQAMKYAGIEDIIEELLNTGKPVTKE